jgi:MFS family permease
MRVITLASGAGAIAGVGYGFLLLMAAQFVSGLADNALLLVTIARLSADGAAAWLLPLLKLVFTLAYVLLAPLVGPLADRWPKARVMLAANTVKALACAALAGGAPALLAFCVAGAGAAVYSPAKYGLVTELVPTRKLVAANGWIEVGTVLAILLGTVLGGALTGSPLQALLARVWASISPTGAAGSDEVALSLGFGVVLLLYALAALLNLGIGDSGARYPAPLPLRRQLADFAQANRRLWADPLGQISLATTTLFWGVGATLQFVVLRWAGEQLGLTLAQAAYLQGLSAIGVVLGAALAGRWVRIEHAPRVLGLGVLMGLLVPLLVHVQEPATAALLLTGIGLLGGLFVVPMNALLQHRGSRLLSAGRSIAVQNFNENACVLLMLALYAGCIALDVPLPTLILGDGLLVALLMALIWLRHRQLRRRRYALTDRLSPVSIQLHEDPA